MEISIKKYTRSDYKHRFLKNLTLNLLLFLDKTNHKDRLNNLITFSGDYIGKEIAVNGYFEADELEPLCEWLEDRQLVNGIALDIGANIGNHSVFFSNYFDKVMSYEPHPITFKVLELNAMKKNNIHCFNFGLSDSERTETIYVTGNFMGSARINPQKTNLTLHQDQIELKTIDTHKVLEDETIGLIKIDIEGHEIFALKGARKLIERDKPVIVFEQHRREFVDGSNQVIDFLKSLDYTFAIILEKPELPTWIPKFFSSRFIRVIKFFVGYTRVIESVDTLKPDFYSMIIAIPKV